MLGKGDIFIGEKENKSIKKSAKIINQSINGSVLTVIPKLHHGEFSINNAQLFASEVIKITGESK